MTPEVGPRMRRARGRGLGEAADVHLVDDRVLHRAPERLVALPVVVGHVDDDAAQRVREVVLRTAGLDPVPERRGGAASVRVDQDLVRVEAMTLTMKVLGAVDPICIAHPGRHPGDMDVPEVEGPVGIGVEDDRLDRLGRVVTLEDQQLDAGGMAGEEREVGALAIGCRPERVRATRAHGEPTSRRVLRRRHGFRRDRVGHDAVAPALPGSSSTKSSLAMVVTGAAPALDHERSSPAGLRWCPHSLPCGYPDARALLPDPAGPQAV